MLGTQNCGNLGLGAMKTPRGAPLSRGTPQSAKVLRPGGGESRPPWLWAVLKALAVLFSLVWLFAVVKVFMLDGSVAPAATAKADTDLVQQTEKKVGLVKKARPIVLLGSKSSSADVSKEDLKVTKRTFVRHVEPPLLTKSKGSVELPLSTEWQLIRTNPNYKVGKNPNYKEGTLAEAPGSGLVVPASPIIAAAAGAGAEAGAGAGAGDKAMAIVHCQ